MKVGNRQRQGGVAGRRDGRAGLGKPVRHQDPAVDPEAVGGVALIIGNGQQVEIGERIRGASVLDIQPSEVVLGKAGKRIVLTLLPTDVAGMKKTGTGK